MSSVAGGKRTLLARLMAESGCVLGMLGIMSSPACQHSEVLCDFNWFGAGILALVFAIYLLSMARQSSRSRSHNQRESPLQGLH
ncbi:MAG: hypothetical protein E8D47_11530 [Nitrospira sp.]|nr:MAG: hypothetical protein E8D47_11530 [Nitrospira sp.]